MKNMGITCPSCYRQRGLEVVIYPKTVAYVLPETGRQATMLVYECGTWYHSDDNQHHYRCGYNTTEHELLFHEYRVRYNRLLDVVLNIRGWIKSQYNTLAGKLLVIERAVENYFEKGKDQ